MKIEIFKPIDFKKKKIDLSHLNKITDRNWIYAANGKSALYHCLKSLNITGSILIPVYICDSILAPIKELDLEVYYYDLDETNLNAEIEDIEQKIIKYDITCVLVAILYGNVIQYDIIEEICNRNDVLMIDDAAQSFGATLNKKHVGTFGNAGFFSFSPGKATTAHMGAFFWTQNQTYHIKRTQHLFFHYVCYLDFYFNRLNIYKYKKYFIFRSFSLLKKLLSKFYIIVNDDICNFEKGILGGVLEANEKQTFRNHFIKKFIEFSKHNDDFKVITKGRLEDNNHKLVLIFKTDLSCSFYFDELLRGAIYCSRGYKLLSDDRDFVNALKVKNKILELPIEDDELKFNLLIDVFKSIEKNNIY